MALHDELRAARIAAELTQTQLAERAGIPRNQIVRAEKGENITLETLRQIVAHLPLESLTLLEKLRLDFDYVPQPERLYYESLKCLRASLDALLNVVQVTLVAREALATARRAHPRTDPGALNRNDDVLLDAIRQAVAHAAVAARGITDR